MLDQPALPTIAYAIDGDDVAGLTTDEKIKLERRPACRRCDQPFAPAPCQVRKHDYLCKACRKLARKSRRTQPILTVEQRLAKYTDRSAGPDACWPWMGARCGGYGLIKISRKMERAHRVAWKISNGRSAPDDMEVCHRCDNPPCVNPGHLWLGTPYANQRDKAVKGRTTRKNGSENPTAKLTADEARHIYRLPPPNWAIALAFNVTESTVATIKRGERWSHATGAPMTLGTNERNRQKRAAEYDVGAERKAALPGFIWRKLLANRMTDFGSRAASIECCKAEMDWAHADWRRIVAEKGFGAADPKEQTWGTPAWQLALLPHEAAAQIVVNIWSEHVAPKEDRARKLWWTMKAQRKAGWNTVEIAKDIRWYLAERRALLPKLKAAIERYAKLRETLDRTPTGREAA